MNRLAGTQALGVYLLAGLILSSSGDAAYAADLHPHTVAAFDHYIALTEARLRQNASFLWIDGLPASRSQEARSRIRRNELVIERIETKDGTREIDVPDGLIHHWIGTAFIAGATIDRALTLLQSYDRHQQIYAPAIAASRLVARDGDRFRFFLRFMMKEVITVVVNTEHEARFRRAGDDRAEAGSQAHALRKSRIPVRPTSARSRLDTTADTSGGSTPTGECSRGTAG